MSSSTASSRPGLLIEGVASIATLAGGLRRGSSQGDAAVIDGDASGRALAVAAWGDRLIAAGRAPDVYSQIEAAGHSLDQFDRVDAAGGLVTPGLIDAHTHLLTNFDTHQKNPFDDPFLFLVKNDLPKRALLGAAMAREMLEAGYTTVRDLGNAGRNGDVALRDAINAGWVPGPRMQVSTRALSPAGGQFSPMTPSVQAIVSTGPNIVTVPRVIAMSQGEAVDKIERTGLHVGKVTKTVDDSEIEIEIAAIQL